MLRRCGARECARRLAIVVCLVGLAPACNRGPEEESSDTPPAARSAPDSPGSLVPPPGAPELPLPPPGSVHVSASGHGFTLLANRAHRVRVLRELERVGGFRLRLGREPGLAHFVTLRVADAEITKVLAEALGGVPFTLGFGIDPEDGRTVLAEVTVGVVESAQLASAAASEERSRRAERRRGREAPTPEEAARRVVESERERQTLLAQLDDPDPAVRAGAAEWIEPEGEGLERLKEILEEDPEPEVRIAATGALADAESLGGVDLLVEALSDPDPRVALAALEALEFTGDATVIPKLRPALERPEPEVRERTVEAIEFLQP